MWAGDEEGGTHMLIFHLFFPASAAPCEMTCPDVPVRLSTDRPGKKRSFGDSRLLCDVSACARAMHAQQLGA